MGKYYGDQNRLVLIPESGTYGTGSSTSGLWVGLVTGNTPNDNMGVITTRFAGTANRNIGRFDDGPQDYDGILTYHPQDLRLLAYALGSCVDAGSPSPYTHVLSEINNNAGNAFTSGTHIPFMSFTLEDSKFSSGTGANFIRTYKGCVVDKWALKGDQGGLLEVDVDWIAQSETFTSGTQTTLAEDTTHTPYKWSNVQVHIPSGTVYQEVKSFEWAVANNFDRNHYLNGSRVIATPQATDRAYMFDITMDMESAKAKTVHESYLVGGSTFNCMLALVASAGSQDAFIIMSGCKMFGDKVDLTATEAQSAALSIVPQTVAANVNDLVQKYNPW